jgi:hypothetical protein
MPQFRVHAQDDHAHRTRVLEEDSFEAAALAYVEDWPHSIDEPPEVRVIVRDLEDGHERCFAIDLETGEAGGCA